MAPPCASSAVQLVLWSIGLLIDFVFWREPVVRGTRSV